jgi:arabinofuranosyltransferase
MIPAGAVALIYEGKIINLLGLNNTMLAHSNAEKKGLKSHSGFNKDIFYKLDLDLIIPSFVEDSMGLITEDIQNKNYKFLMETLNGLLTDEKFNNEFIPAVVRKANNTKYLFAYFKRSYVQELIKNGFIVKTKI